VGAETAIEWCHHTFNPWWGCQRVSPGCEHCYAETFSYRLGLKIWGPGDRRFFGDKHWAEPLKWNREAEKAGVPRRVFCASMADVFEDRRDLDAPRARLWGLITATPMLTWLLLTKRPENVPRFLPAEWVADKVPINVWLGFTAEDQPRFDQRIVHVANWPTHITSFCSYEPALGPLDIGPLGEFYIDWLIAGGESGGGARACRLEWFRSVRDQCSAAGLAFFMKQAGARPIVFDGEHEWFDGEDFHRGGYRLLKLHDRKGGDLAELPDDLRKREFPA
jgi:protein gp37